MTQFSNCINIINGMDQSDQDYLLERLDHHTKGGMPAWRAQTLAAKDALNRIRKESKSFGPGSEAFQKWFGNSKVVDAEGEPLIVYRGEHGAGDRGPQSTLASLTFTNDPDVASTYAQTPNDTRNFVSAESPRVYAAYLSIQNPVFNNQDDPFVDMSILVDRLGRENAEKIARKFSDRIMNTGAWEEFADYEDVGALLDAQPGALESLYVDAYPLLDDFQFVGMAKDSGYDGAIHMGNGESMDAVEYHPFSINQVKSSIGNDGSYDPESSDIRMSARVTETPAFKEWFGDSQVVDANGDPLPMYRGQGAEFNDKPLDGRYFTKDPAYAATYNFDDNTNILKVYISAKNIYMPDAVSDVTDYNFDDQELIKQGYDAIATKDLSVLVPLKGPEQIKSAIGNGGAFGPANPDIRMSARLVDTPAFKSWFDGSAVVGDSGEPVVAYHGGADVSEFKSPTGGGIFFTSNKSIAADYRDISSGNATLTPAYLSMKKPLIVNAPGDFWDDISVHSIEVDQARRKELFPVAMRSTYTTEEIALAAAKHGGYDGVIFKKIKDAPKGKSRKSDVYAVFKSEQIKSATENNGEFNSKNPDIRKSARELPRGYVGEPTQEEDRLEVELATMMRKHTDAWRVGAKAAADYIEDRLIKSGAAEGDAAKEMAPRLAHTVIGNGNEFDPETHESFKQYRDIGAAMATLRARIRDLIDARVGPPEFEEMQQPGQYDRPQIRTKAFRDWFEGSAVENDGVPIIAFHGSPVDFTEFNTEPQDRENINNRNWLGQMGSWFAAPGGWEYEAGNAESIADGFAQRGDGSGATIYPVYLSIKRPKSFEGYWDLQEEVADAGGALKYRKQLEADGYDGLVIYGSDTDGGSPRNDWVAFKPTQIKSAIGNNGDFDATNPDIRFSARADEPVNKLSDPKEYEAALKGYVDYYDNEEKSKGLLNDYSIGVDLLLKRGGNVHRLIWASDLESVNLEKLGLHWTLDESNFERLMHLAPKDAWKDGLKMFHIRAKVPPGSVSNKRVDLAGNPEEEEVNIVSNLDEVQYEVMELNLDGSNGPVLLKLNGKEGIRLSARPAGATWDSPEKTKFDDFVYKSQNKMIDVKRVIESITKATGKIANDLNVYLQEELFHGRAAKRTQDFGNNELKPMLDLMRANGLTIGDVEEYLHARHAKEANAIIADREPSMPDGGSGMMNAEVDRYFARLMPNQEQKLKAVAAQVDAMIATTRQMYADYNLESQDTVDGWGEMFKHYVPLQREDKNKSGGMGIGQGFSVKGKETRGRTGSKRKVVDILANIAMQREKVIVRGEKNRVSQALVGLVMANPNSDFWEVGPPPTERVYDPKTNSVVDRPDPLFKSRENVIVAKVANASGGVDEIAVRFNEDNDRAMRMAQSLKNMDAGNLEGLLGVSAKITRYFAAINTQYNPIFGVVNLVRDVQDALIGLGGTPLEKRRGRIARDTISALSGIYADMRATRQGRQPTSQWSALWEEFQGEGGQTGYRDMFATSKDRADALQKILTPNGWMDSDIGKIFTANGALRAPMAKAQGAAEFIFNWLSDYNEAMENGVRLATYKAALDKGMSRQEAASFAKNITVNFNRKGQVAQQAGAMYAFFNAAMQGTARIGRTLFTMEGGDVKTMRLSPTGKKVMYGGMLIGTMQALSLAAAGFGDDDPPDFVRERNLVIPTGGSSYVTIPMPLGLHVIPGFGRQMTEFALAGFDKPQQRAIKLFGMFADAFNPIGNAGLSMQTLAPTALDPLVALTENKDYTGKPIARTSNNSATPGFTQFKDSATAMGKVIAEAINGLTGGNAYVAGAISPTPDQIDYLIGQATGGVGRELSKLEQTTVNAVTGEEIPPNKIPLLGRFYGNTKSQANQAGTFYGNVNKLNELETEIKGMVKDGKGAEAAELRASKPEAYLIAQANVAERQVQRLRREKRELVANGATQAEVRAKEEQITRVMTRLNTAMEELQAKSK